MQRLCIAAGSTVRCVLWTDGLVLHRGLLSGRHCPLAPGSRRKDGRLLRRSHERTANRFCYGHRWVHLNSHVGESNVQRRRCGIAKRRLSPLPGASGHRLNSCHQSPRRPKMKSLEFQRLSPSPTRVSSPPKGGRAEEDRARLRWVCPGN